MGSFAMDFLIKYHDEIPADVRSVINKKMNKQRDIIASMTATLDGIVMAPFGDHLGDDYPSANEAAHAFQVQAITCLAKCEEL